MVAFAYAPMQTGWDQVARLYNDVVADELRVTRGGATLSPKWAPTRRLTDSIDSSYLWMKYSDDDNDNDDDKALRHGYKDLVNNDIL